MHRFNPKLRPVNRTESNHQKFRLTCSMQLADGRRVSARIESDSPIHDAHVRYSGAVNLLPFRCRQANSLVLRALFRSFAGDLRAEYQEVLVEKTNGSRRSARNGHRRQSS